MERGRWDVMGVAVGCGREGVGRDAREAKNPRAGVGIGVARGTERGLICALRA
jgi:hypothetical protein